jgi:PPE-repeat protein
VEFWTLPPEINSARLYAGPGPGSLMAAAAAWDGVASELHSTATSWSWVISALTNQHWQGPSSASMATAAGQFTSWIRSTATQAEEASAQAKAAVGAYEAALTLTVPPAAIATNRITARTLIATNTLGQNTPAIAAYEAQYGEMWAQDVVAMEGYADSSTAAAQLTPFTSPAQVANPAASSGAASISTIISDIVNAISTVLSDITSAISTIISNIASAVSTIISEVISNLSNIVTAIITVISSVDNVLTDVASSVSIAIAAASLGIATANFAKLNENDAKRGNAGNGQGQETQPGAGDEQASAAALESRAAAGAGVGPVAAGAGRATLVGALSAPPTWTMSPMMRQIAKVLPITDGTPMIMQGSDDQYTNMALAGLIWSSLTGIAAKGGAAPKTAAGHEATRTAAAAAAAATPAVPTTTTIVSNPTGAVPAELAAALAAMPGATVIVIPPAAAAN